VSAPVTIQSPSASTGSLLETPEIRHAGATSTASLTFTDNTIGTIL